MAENRNTTIDSTKIENLKNKLIRVFHEGENNYEQIVLELNDANSNFITLKYYDLFQEQKAFADYCSTFYNLLDYFDIKNLQLNKFIIDKFGEHLSKAREFLPNNPEISISLLRLAICAANICYREQRYSDGKNYLDRIKTITSSIFFKEKEPGVSPSFFADLCFEEARFLVRDNCFFEAKLLLIQAIKKYEEWEVRKNSHQKGSSEFRDFITYKISNAQAFYLYSNILQGKIETVVRESSTIERLLDYTNHKILKHFVQMLRAKALRLSGFQNKKQLLDAAQLLKDTQKVLGNYQNIKEFDKLHPNFKRSNYQRFFLMNLFQQGLTYLYLSEPITKKKTDQKQKKKVKPKNNEFTDESWKIIELLERLELNDYWKIRANLLKVYHFLSLGESEKAFKTALKNLKITTANEFLQVELLTAIAEAGITHLTIMSETNHSTEPVTLYDQIIQDIEEALNKCSEIEKAFYQQGQSDQIPNKPNPLLKVFALYYLLQCQFNILLGDYDEAKRFWGKWTNIADVIQFSRWQELARSIKQILEDSENKLTIDLSKSYRYEDAKEVLQDWLFNKVKKQFPTDDVRIKELGVSRESYYKWKKRSKSGNS